MEVRILGHFLGDLFPSPTLSYSRAWTVTGEGIWNHLNPSSHAEETEASRRKVAFPSQSTSEGQDS